MMKNWKKTLLPLTVLALALPTAAFAAADGKVAPDPSSGTGIVQKVKDQVHNKRITVVKELKPGVHTEMYITLLAEKYAPETSAEWEAVFAQRKELVEALKALKPTEAERAALKQKAEEKRAELKEKLQAGEITKEELKQQVADIAGTWKSKLQQRNESLEALGDQEFKKQLTDAVAAKDAELIHTALNGMLEQAKSVNTRLAEILAKLQGTQETAQQ